MRLWFTNIYAVVIAAILVFMGKGDNVSLLDFDPTLFLVLFGLILSVLGFLVVVAVSVGYEQYMLYIVMVFYSWNKMEFFRHSTKPVHFRTVHRCFYEITTAFFAVLSLFEVFQAQISFMLVFIAIFFTIEVLYQLFWKRYSKDRWLFTDILREDTKGEYRNDWEKWFRDPDKDFWRKIIEDARQKGILEDKKSWIQKILSWGKQPREEEDNTF